MLKPDGSPHTAHTTNLVHFLYVAEDAEGFWLKDGILADIAPTILDLLQLEKPAVMTGQSLLVKRAESDRKTSAADKTARRL